MNNNTFNQIQSNLSHTRNATRATVSGPSFHSNLEATAYLVQAHNFDHPSLQMEDLFASQPHPDFLYWHRKPRHGCQKFDSRTYIAAQCIISAFRLSSTRSTTRSAMVYDSHQRSAQHNPKSPCSPSGSSWAVCSARAAHTASHARPSRAAASVLE